MADFEQPARQFFRSEIRKLKMGEVALQRARLRAKELQRRTKHAHRLLLGYNAYLAEDPEHGAADPDHRSRVTQLFRSQFMPEFMECASENHFVQRDLPWLSRTARSMIALAEEHRPRHYTEHAYVCYTTYLL